MGQSPPWAGRRRGRPPALQALFPFGSAFLLVSGLLLSEPLVLGQDGPPAPTPLVTVSGDGIGTVGTKDTGFFNYANYQQSTLRIARLNLDLSLRLGSRAALLGELRVDNGDGVLVSALYLRVRVLEGLPLDLQVGRIPPVFGAFGRRSYGADNPLIGLPLGYQYLTILRPDAFPGSADDLLMNRGSGWGVAYPMGAPYVFGPGLPIVSADRWDTGAEVRLGGPKARLALGVTQGSLGNPLVKDDNSGKQVVGRFETRPSAAWTLGVSGARGAYISKAALASLPPGNDGGPFTQSALGLDAEWADGYWILRFEGIASEWRVPIVEAPFITSPLKAYTGSLEARYKIRPGLYAAARLDRLGFSSITGTLFGGRPTSWDAPVSRVEVGGGYYVRHNILLKAVFQQNWRETPTSKSLGLVSAQALFWF